FFFHAEDGIRARNVTGVQTCALPISGWLIRLEPTGEPSRAGELSTTGQLPLYAGPPTRYFTVTPLRSRRLFHLDVCHVPAVARLIFRCGLNLWVRLRSALRRKRLFFHKVVNRRLDKSLWRT